MKNSTRAASAIIIQRVLPHYRLAFFDRLHERLRQRGIGLSLVYGQELPGTVPATVDFYRDWATRIHNRYFRVARSNLVWQPCLGVLAKSSLVIVEQANSLLLNYGLLAARKAGIYRMAYWGHGRNFQTSGKQGLREGFKSALITSVDWWFAYTELSAAIVKDRGFPAKRVSVVNNSIDTDELRTAMDAVNLGQVLGTRRDLGISGDHVGIYCGGLYGDKQLDFLLDACGKIRQRIRDFHLIVLGSGPEQDKIIRASAECPWIHYVGARFGKDRAVYFRVAKILMMPGLVGLVIIDAFTAETPLFTTDVPIHSPEIAYLTNGCNGVMTAHDPEAYAEAVSSYFTSPDYRERLQRGCRNSAEKYGLDSFVGNFAEGIERCLLSP